MKYRPRCLTTKTHALIGAHLLAICAFPAWGDRAHRVVLAMGTVVELAVSASRPDRADAVCERILSSLSATEQRLSTWRDDTELAAVNAAEIGVALQLSPQTAADLADAQFWCRATAGAFDPAVGQLVRLWDLRGRGCRPSESAIEAARRSSGSGGWSLSGRELVRREAVLIEEGAFGKGAALREALAASEEADEVWIDIGGQVVRAGGTGVRPVSIAHPHDRQRAVLELPLESGSLSTSGNSERSLAIEGEVLGHILDPRTGQPAVAWGSMTVWHPDALAADALSTALYVMGPVEGIRWAEAHPPARAVALEWRDDGLVLHASTGWRSALTELVPMRKAWMSEQANNPINKGEKE